MIGFIWQLCLLALVLIPLLIWWYYRNMKRPGENVALFTDVAFFKKFSHTAFCGAARSSSSLVCAGTWLVGHGAGTTNCAFSNAR